MPVKKFRRMRLTILVIVLMAISFYAGRQYAPKGYQLSPRHLFAALSGAAEPSGGSQDISLKPVVAFQETMSALRQNYVSGISKQQETKLTYAAIRGLLAGLEDPYTRFLDPEEFKEFQEENLGRFQGIGATLEMAESIDPAAEKNKGKEDAALSLFRCKICGADWENLLAYRIARMSQNGFEAEFTHEPPFYRHYRVTVVAPITGGPADKAGIRAGDQIIKVGNTSTFGMPLDEVVKLIRGPAETTVDLLITRKGVKQSIPFKITRKDIDSPTVESQMLPDHIGYLRLNNFSDGRAAKKVEEGLAALREQGMKALLLDLRNNGGGNLEVCLKIASQLLPAGPVVLIQAKGEEIKTENAPKSSHGLGLPMVVLVNQGSASASEILAGALQDRKAAKLVGERTFGKGLVQTVGAMPDGSALIITTAVYFTPLHRDVNKRGIEPDVAVKQPDDGERVNIKFLSDRDLQAKEAVKLLQSEVKPPAKAAQGRRAPALSLH